MLMQITDIVAAIPSQNLVVLVTHHDSHQPSALFLLTYGLVTATIQIRIDLIRRPFDSCSTAYQKVTKVAVT